MAEQKRQGTLSWGTAANPALEGTLGWEQRPAEKRPPAPPAPPAPDPALAGTAQATAPLGGTAFAPTIDAPATLAGTGALGALGVTASVRSTVLPRVERIGAESKLILDSRLRYEPTRSLGSGAAGDVAAALDNDIGRTVAVKRIRREVQSDAMVVRFADEIRTVGALEHPNIVPIHDVGVDENGEYYFVMKYVDGETLQDVVEKLRARDPAYVARYGMEARVQLFRGIVEAVAFAHDRGVVHRDIKPANIMVGRFGEVVLMDWGIAKRVERGDDDVGPVPRDVGEGPARLFKTQVGSLVGTPMYMSPEQARGEPADARSDTYALTVVLQELLWLDHYVAGQTTLDGLLKAIQTENVNPLVMTERFEIVPAELKWFVERGLRKPPGERYQSAREMLDRLDRRAEGDFPVQCHLTFAKRMTMRWVRFLDGHPRFMTWVMPLCVLGVVAAVVLALR